MVHKYQKTEKNASIVKGIRVQTHSFYFYPKNAIHFCMSNTKPLAIVILAAGVGSRMKSDLPKVMHRLAGRPMINWLLETAESLNPDKIIVVVGPDMPALERASAPHKTVIQQVRNGTGGALICAMPHLKNFKGDVLVLLGDAPLISKRTLQALIRARGNELLTGLSVLGVERADPHGYGRLVIDSRKLLEKIVEEKDANPKEKKITLVNTGAFCLNGERLSGWLEQLGNKNAQGEFYITDLPAIAARKSYATRVHITTDEAEVQGCNTRADLAMLEATMQMRLRMAALAGGVTILDPASVYLSYDTHLGRDTVVEPNVFFGPGVTVDSDVHIKAFSHLEGVRVRRGAVIGPFARLRPETDIGEDARVGNFVEIKKSTIGKRSKINHLAYVGDCTMGDDVNFSAGAITVNFDGFQKHETHIGKGVMVGSNVNLVAPVTIDDGAFIAAGSTITENVPADALSISRDVGKIREGWAAEYRKRKEAIAKKLGRKNKP